MSALKSLLTKSPKDTIILTALRTPITRAHKGGLAHTYPEELLHTVLRGTLLATPQLDPAVVEDVAVGVVLSELGGSKAARMAALQAGLPVRTAVWTVNRACGSSLQAICSISAAIRAGDVTTGIAAGMESMSRNYGSRAIPGDVWPLLKEREGRVGDCVLPMGITGENVAERYGVSRADQDGFAVESHLRAAHAQREGLFKGEIVPVRTRVKDEDGEEREVVVDRDDGVRADVSMQKMGMLKPVFKAGGSGTAGNSSQVSDGAAAVLLMRRDVAVGMGLGGRILGRFVGAVTVGCEPDEMGVGPAVAVPKLLGRYGLGIEDVDRWEINEAFASQAVYCVRKLGLERDWVDGKVNPDGGAIALGHPLGATGARLASTLLHGLRRSQGEVGVVTLCVGTGMGMAGLFVRE